MKKPYPLKQIEKNVSANDLFRSEFLKNICLEKNNKFNRPARLRKPRRSSGKKAVA
ncbi:Uncharacterized protein dnm_043360 [Desulfonema magnum]|uniref:Uncharacterized protein n=1 Tax=Desulfonema magnum TaxID=45655 RepID=A0A975BN84_9BACT|nr:Uncharacterized protein dnm_043360 [Desulfonema magnum]